MPTPRAWPDPFAPDTPPALSWPAWVAFAALVMAVGLVEMVARAIGAAAEAERQMGAVDTVISALGPAPAPVRWRLAIGPDGSASVVSDRTPGPRPGQGDLRKWFYAGKWSEDFDAVRAASRGHNAPRTRDPLTVDEVLDHLMVKNADLMRRLGPAGDQDNNEETTREGSS